MSPRLWRVVIALHYLYGKDGAVWKGSNHLRTFYVHAASGPEARQAAESIVNPHNDKRTSGSVIGVDSDLDAIPETYYAWGEVSNESPVNAY